MIVECSFCTLKFHPDDIVVKEVDCKYARAMKNMVHMKLEEQDDKVYGQYCPGCDKLHVVGFREPIAHTIRKVQSC